MTKKPSPPRDPVLPRHWRVTGPTNWAHIKLEPDDGRLFAIQRCDGPGFFFRPGEGFSTRKEVLRLIQSVERTSPRTGCGCTPEAMLAWEIQLALRQENKSRGKKAKASLRNGDR